MSHRLAASPALALIAGAAIAACGGMAGPASPGASANVPDAAASIPTARSSPAPATRTPTPTATPSNRPMGAIFDVPGSTARFSFLIPEGWRRGTGWQGPPAGVRFIARYGLGPTWDPMPLAWIDVTATDERFGKVEAQVIASGRTEEPRAIEVDGLDGVYLTGEFEAGLDPIALVRASGHTFRITAHDEDGPRRGLWLLEGFVGRFVPLPSAS